METVEDVQKYEKEYNESSFWDKILNFAKRAGIELIYLVLLLYYTLDSNTLSLKDRIIVIGALGYFILPVDLIPDYIPIIGLTDDFGAISYAYNKIKENITDEIREQARNKVHSIFGDFDKDKIEKY